MFKILVKWLFISSTFLLFVGCGSEWKGDIEEEENISGITVDDFNNQIKFSAGKNAINCGRLEPNEDSSEINSCVIEAFENKQSFYVVYRLQGIDSTVIEGVSYNENNRLILWSFDSDPGGGGRFNGNIYERICQDATINPNIYDDRYEIYWNIFSCHYI